MKCTRIFFIVCLLIVFRQISLYPQSDANYWFTKGRETSSKTDKIKFYKKAIELRSNFIEAYFNLGRTYKNIGRLQDAEESYKNALFSNPSKLNNQLRQPILYELGLVYEKMGKYDKAEESLLKALKFSRNSSQKAIVLYRIGLVNMLMKRFKKAITYYQEGLEVYPLNKTSFETAIALAQDQEKVDKFYKEGLNFYNLQKHNEAISAFEKVININPAFKDTKKLIEESKNKLKNITDNSELKELFDNGVAYIGKKDWPAAIDAFERVLAKSPDYDKAQQYLTLAQQKFETNLITKSVSQHYQEGKSAVARGDYINAIIAYERVKEIDPTYRNINMQIQQVQAKLEVQNHRTTKMKFYDQGLLAYEKGDWYEALNTFNKLYVLDSNYKDIQYMIKNTKERLNAMTRQETIETYYQKGLALIQKEDWLNALINFEKVKMIDANYKEVDVLIDQSKNKFNESQQEIFAAQAPMPTKKRNSLLLIGITVIAVLIPLGGFILLSPVARARIYLIQKKYDKARNIYENILNYNPGKVKLYINLANIYINENRQDEIAVKVFEKVVESNLSEELKNRLTSIINNYYLEKARIERKFIDTTPHY